MYIRKRGKFYYVSGKVRVGHKTTIIKEHSTGYTKLQDAREYANRLISEIQEKSLNPSVDKTSKTTFDDCLTNYLNKKRPSRRELSKIKMLLDVFEGTNVSDIKEQWNVFCIKHRENSMSTINRYRAMLMSILNLAKEDLEITVPIIKSTPVKNTVVFMLKDDFREKLLNCYSDIVKPIFTVIAYQGMRTQECLQLLWEDIDLKEKTIVIRTSKNGETRQVPMNKRTFWVIAREWFKKGKPKTGHVWTNSKGNIYKDTRKTAAGDSPILKHHTRALAKLKRVYGIDVKMRVHDWRHDWASRMVMAGVDLLTIQKLGGWKSLEMVKRYAALSSKHEKEAINKI